MAQRPIFVVGYQRSGTTLLQSLLGAHPCIAAPPELHFILRVAYFADYFGDLADDDNLRRALGEALNPPVDILTECGFDEDALFERARSGERTYAGLFAAMLEDYTERNGKQRWAEKTPSQRPDDIYNLFPDALVVHIVRDPRDRCCLEPRDALGAARRRRGCARPAGLHARLGRARTARRPQPVPPSALRGPRA
jgi:Sulfotransferase family